MNKSDNTVLPDGEKIRQLRRAKPLTQEKLALEAGVSKSTIERIERGEPAYISTLDLVAEALDVAGKELLFVGDESGFSGQHRSVSPGDGYLRPIMHVLRPSIKEAQWFRHEGPLAIDFEQNVVYQQRPSFSVLKELTLDNSASLLVGRLATGKTTVVRQLGYDLVINNEVPVYWFDGALDKGFNKDQLIQEINSLTGVFILENVHIEIRKFQRILYYVHDDPNRHVLFTAQPSFITREAKQDLCISELDQIKLEPFDDVDSIINHYTSQDKNMLWTQDVIASIKNVSGGDYWVLSYALTGCSKMKGEGDPLDWPKAGVLAHLGDLEEKNNHFPEVLVALSPVCHNEVLMEERHLIKILGFDLKILRELSRLGEITQQNVQSGCVFYGLPHSALAKLYWKHGLKYRRRKDLPKYQDFIYRYAADDVPNSLEAILAADPTTRNRLLSRFEENKETNRIISQEQSLYAISFWASIIPSHILNSEGRLNKELLNVLAEKIITKEDLSDAGQLIARMDDAEYQAGKYLWRKVRKRLSKRLSRSADLGDITTCIFDICAIKEFRSELFTLLNWKKIASNILTTEDIFYVESFFNIIRFCNFGEAIRICDELDATSFAKRLRQEEDHDKIKSCIKAITDLCPQKGQELADLLNIE